MSVGQRIRQLFEDRIDLFQIHRSGSSGAFRHGVNLLLERSAIDQLHDNIQVPIMSVKVMNGHDIGVRKPGDHLGLKVETVHKIAVRSIPGGKYFDRYFPAKILLAGAIDTSHASLAQGSQNFVIAKCCANQGVLLHNLLYYPMKKTFCMQNGAHVYRAYHLLVLYTQSWHWRFHALPFSAVSACQKPAPSGPVGLYRPPEAARADIY